MHLSCCSKGFGGRKALWRATTFLGLVNPEHHSYYKLCYNNSAEQKIGTLCLVRDSQIGKQKCKQKNPSSVIIRGSCCSNQLIKKLEASWLTTFSSLLHPYILSKQVEERRRHLVKPLKKRSPLLFKEELHSTFL